MSKANWNSNMGVRPPVLFGDGMYECLIVNKEKRTTIAKVVMAEKQQALFAAKQICAIEEMVALLKQVATEKTGVITRYYDGRGDVEELSKNAVDARAILRKIGEI